MRPFEDPKLEVVLFTVEDIVTTSGGEEETLPNFYPAPCV